MTPSSEMGWRVTQLERSVRDLDRHIDDGFGKLAGRIDSLEFLPREVFNVKMTSTDDKMKELQEMCKGAVSLARACLFAIVTVVLASVFAIMVASA